MLAVGKQDFEPIERMFKDMGFDRVYPPGTDPQKVIDDLWRDLREKGKF